LISGHVCTNRRIANNPFGVIELCVFRMWTLIKVAQPLIFHSGTLRIVKLPPKAKPGSWLCFPMVTTRTRTTTPPKFSQKGWC
jgi:hypothetical protein